MVTNADMTVRVVGENPDAEVSIVGGQVIEATAADVGKVVVVGADGTLGLVAEDALGVDPDSPLTLTDEGATDVLDIRGVPVQVASLTPAAAIVSDAAEQHLTTAAWSSATNQLAAGDRLILRASGSRVNADGTNSHTTALRWRADGVVVAVANLIGAGNAGAIAQAWLFEVELLIDATGLAMTVSGRATLRGLTATNTDAFAQTITDSAGAIDPTQVIDWWLSADHDAALSTLTIDAHSVTIDHIRAPA